MMGVKRIDTVAKSMILGFARKKRGSHMSEFQWEN